MTYLWLNLKLWSVNGLDPIVPRHFNVRVKSVLRTRYETRFGHEILHWQKKKNN